MALHTVGCPNPQALLPLPLPHPWSNKEQLLFLVTSCCRNQFEDWLCGTSVAWVQLSLLCTTFWLHYMYTVSCRITTLFYFRFDEDPSVLDDLYLDLSRPAFNIALKGKFWVQQLLLKSAGLHAPLNSLTLKFNVYSFWLQLSSVFLANRVHSWSSTQANRNLPQHAHRWTQSCHPVCFNTHAVIPWLKVQYV